MVAMSSPQEAEAEACSRRLGQWLRDHFSQLSMIGPTEATVAKKNDMYRRVIYLKSEDYEELVCAKDGLEEMMSQGLWRQTTVQFDFNPLNGF